MDYFIFETTDVCRTLAHISSALSYLHDQGIAHQNVTLFSILYTRDTLSEEGPYSATSGATLTCFSFAIPSDTMTCEGTLWYLPPEAIEGSRGAQGDVFALGVVMLYLMRIIDLPKQSPAYAEWDLALAMEGKHTAVQAMVDWQGSIVRYAEALRCTSEDSDNNELCQLVYRMLLADEASRITSRELAKATGKWQ